MKPQMKALPRQRHVPLRRCVVCRSSRPQAELLRFYRDEDGRYQHDAARKAGGRGVWICCDRPECQHVKALRRFFRNDAADVASQLNALILNQASQAQASQAQAS